MSILKKFEGFSYSNRSLLCEKVPVESIIRKFGSPVYIYSKSALKNRINRLQHSIRNVNCKIFFSVKACSNIHILEILKNSKCGVDIVSGGELIRASIAKIPGSDIIFSGVGKSHIELQEAMNAKIHLFNIESIPELQLLNYLAAHYNTNVQVCLRINPNIDAKTHPYISTGLKNNKFGLSKSELNEIYKHLSEFNHIQFKGLSCHIGSQITKQKPFAEAWKQMIEFAKKAPFNVQYLNLGGGVGIDYTNEKCLELEDYGKLITSTFQGLNYELAIEPGRALIGPTAILATQLLFHKKRGKHSFYIIDAAMNDLMRPALYNAIHPVIPINTPASRKRLFVDLVGQICETSDTFQRKVQLPELASGDYLAFGNAGAYGMSMSSQYNSRPRAAEILVDGSQVHQIRSRENYADLIQREVY